VAPRAYCLTIAGCPYAFTDTPGLPSLTSTSPLWPSPPEVAAGFLVRPTNRWVERAKPLAGDLDVDAQRWQLHDARIGGHNLFTWLSTRDPANVTSTPLAASMSATAMTFNVGNAGLLTVPGYVWIEGEALDCASVSGNTVTVATGGRGALGTKAVAHTIDPAQARYPEAFADLPWIVRRKVCLWSVDTAGVCTLLWMGFATRAPALADNGAQFDLACDHAWMVLANNPVGGMLGGTRAVGFGSALSARSSATALLQTAFWVNVSGTVARGMAVSRGPFRSWDELARDHEAAFFADTTSHGGRVALSILRSGSQARVDADCSTATVGGFGVRLTVGGTSTEPQDSQPRGTGREGVSFALTGLPSTMYVTLQGVSTRILVDGLATLPASWSTSTSTDGSFTTSAAPALRCQYSDRLSLLLTDVTQADGGALGPRVTGIAVVMPRKPGIELTPADMVVMLKDPPPLQVVYRVRADHWAWGLRRAVVGLCEDSHPDDFDWSDVSDVAEASAGLRVARDWIFDGRRTLGDVTREACLLHGCSPVIRSGRLALYAWRWPDARSTPATSITRNDIIGTPSWSRWSEGLANRLRLKSPDLNIDASQAQSRARYGPGREIAVELAGLDDQASPIGDPLDFARSVLGRLELWSDPLAVVRFRVDGSRLATLELGRELTASEWMLPDGAGSRGLSAVRAVVLGREVDLGSATLTIEALVWSRQSHAYAPCAKVKTQVSTTVVEVEAAGWTAGGGSYSGGEDIATFAVGDKVDILSREASPIVDAGQTIAAINAGTRRITFASAMSAGIRARIAAGAWVDVRFASYGTPVVASQERWMFVGDDVTRVIDGTTDPARAVAP
jgi:hypothetical protein